MKVELPEVKRCCFCIPLRYGLLLWGYLKLILTLLVLAAQIVTLVIITNSSLVKYFIVAIVVTSLQSAYLILDVGFTLAFLIGGHMKNIRILHIFYVYSIVSLCIMGLFFLWSTGQDLQIISKLISLELKEGHLFLYKSLRGYFIIGVVLFGLQTYFIILIKNEVDKLRNRNRDNYRFSNPALEASAAVETGNIEGNRGQVQVAEYGNKADTQFIGIVNQAQNARDDFNYDKLNNDNVNVY